jgi:hypothetical protein
MPVPLEARLRRRLEWRGTHLIWTGGVRDGYGSVWLSGGLHASAHRLVWELVTGKPLHPSVRLVNLRDVCGIRRCCALEHHRVMTAGQQILYARALLEQPSSRTLGILPCPARGHDPARTYLSGGRWYCQDCRNERNRAWRARRAA